MNQGTAKEVEPNLIEQLSRLQADRNHSQAEELLQRHYPRENWVDGDENCCVTIKSLETFYEMIRVLQPQVEVNILNRSINRHLAAQLQETPDRVFALPLHNEIQSDKTGVPAREISDLKEAVERRQQRSHTSTADEVAPLRPTMAYVEANLNSRSPAMISQRPNALSKVFSQGVIKAINRRKKSTAISSSS